MNFADTNMYLPSAAAALPADEVGAALKSWRLWSTSEMDAQLALPE